MDKCCPICQSPVRPLTDRQLRINTTYVRYHVCETCHFIYKDSAFHPSPENEKKQYDFHENTTLNTGYVHMFERFLEEAVAPFVTSGKALDFGCGPGPVLLEMLKKSGFDAYGYDPYYAFKNNAFDTTYDVITATEVFEHLFTPLETIDQITQLLKPNGILAVMTQFRPLEDEAFLSWWYRRDPTHVGFFTPQTFKVLAHKLNLSIRYTNHQTIVVFQKG